MSGNLDPGAMQPTPYADVNEALRWFLARIQAILGEQFQALYLSGSLALGDFDRTRSDVDFVVATGAELSDAQFAALRDMHARFNAGDSPWATEVEAAYIPLDVLRWYDPARAIQPHIHRGAQEVLALDYLADDWVLQRYIMREHGVVVAGPPPRTLIDPVQPDKMRRAVVALMDVWWGLMLHDPAPLHHRGYQVYAALTMCRVLFTLDTGAVTSKPAAARWAHSALDERWHGLIDRAVAWRKDQQQTLDADVPATLDLIRYTLERCRASVSSAPP